MMKQGFAGYLPQHGQVGDGAGETRVGLAQEGCPKRDLD